VVMACSQSIFGQNSGSRSRVSYSGQLRCDTLQGSPFTLWQMLVNLWLSQWWMKL